MVVRRTAIASGLHRAAQLGLGGLKRSASSRSLRSSVAAHERIRRGDFRLRLILVFAHIRYVGLSQLPCRSAAAGAEPKTREREQIRGSLPRGQCGNRSRLSGANPRTTRRCLGTVPIIRQHRARSHRSFSTQRSATDDGVNRAPEAAEGIRCYGETTFRSAACRASREQAAVRPRRVGAAVRSRPRVRRRVPTP